MKMMVIKPFDITEKDIPVPVGQLLDVRFTDPENTTDSGIAYYGDVMICDIPSPFANEHLRLYETNPPDAVYTVLHIVENVRVIQTEHGFLDDDISEGFWLEDDEPNYDFTDNPFRAAQFPDDDTVPKYLGVSPEAELKTAQECADYVGGRLITIRLTQSRTWSFV